MTEAEFLAALEGCTLPPQAFHHRDHVRAAWAYLERFPFGAAVDRMRETLRRYTASLGKPERYHDTITVAFMALVQTHRALRSCASWDEFAAAHPQLFASDLLTQYYDPATLASPLARRTFLLEPRNPRGVIRDQGRQEEVSSGSH